MKTIVQRLVTAAVALIAGVLAYKTKLKSTEAERDALKTANTDLQKQVDQNGGLSDALKAQQTAYNDLVAKNAEDNIEATNIIASAEQTVADIHNDPEIPITVEDGVVVHDAEAPLPEVVPPAPAGDPVPVVPPGGESQPPENQPPAPPPTE